jgi:Spy/CpxP family protein refolding chaperone
MRKVLAALAAGALAVTLSAPAAHAASPANPAQQVQLQSNHRDGGDDWGDRREGRRCHHGLIGGIVGVVLDWLV